MSSTPTEVSFSVGGRKYTVACAAGEEQKVAALGALIDGKLDQLGGNLAPQETQNLLFAALLLADELQEAKTQVDEAAKSRADTEGQRETALKEANDRAAASAAEADTLRRDSERLASELAEARASLSAGSNGGSAPAAIDPDLAPALERFADMLENCADKLEGKAHAP